jgi:leucyl/phenylalanyl-tRNA--protein transferase
VAINGFFSGESMFYTLPNASKFALIALSELLKLIDVDFIDCQLLNDFLEDMGATEISREDFVVFKDTAINKDIPVNFWQPRELTITYCKIK